MKNILFLLSVLCLVIVGCKEKEEPKSIFGEDVQRPKVEVIDTAVVIGIIKRMPDSNLGFVQLSFDNGEKFFRKDDDREDIQNSGGHNSPYAVERFDTCLIKMKPDGSVDFLKNITSDRHYKGPRKAE